MRMRSLSYSRGNPYLMMMALGIFGSGIMFLFLAVIFIRKMSVSGQGSIEIPPAFSFSTVTLLLSSVSLTLANQMIIKERYQLAYNWCTITLALGVGFCLLQWAGWQVLFAQNQTMKQAFPAFLFIFTGLHFMHILLGLMGLVIITFHAHQNREYVDGFIQTLNPANRTFLKMTTWFWHFLDFLWVVLFWLLWVFSKN